MADDLKVRLTVLLPDGTPAPSPRPVSPRVLLPDVPTPPDGARQRRLPVQPADVPAGFVWCGPDDGLVPFTGTRPRAGDLVVIVGGRARRFVTSPLAAEPIRWPTFGQACRCRCTTNTGTAVYATSNRGILNLIGLDLTTGDVQQFFGLNELGGETGVFNFVYRTAPVAIDPVSPFDLYVMDDRRFWTTRRLDDLPTPTRGYLTLVRYALSGGQYAPVEYTHLTDPGVVGFEENDPPPVDTNYLSVVGQLPHITLRDAPTRYLTAEGGVVTTHTLTRNGSPYTLGLRGNIVTVPDRPAQPNQRYVIAADASNTTYELLRFAADDEITGVLSLDGLTAPSQLAPFCNRILILNASIEESS